MKLRNRIIKLVSETNKIRKIKLELLKPNDEGHIRIPSLRIHANNPRYVVWVEDNEGNIVHSYYKISVGGEYKKAYKVFDSRTLAAKCFEKTVLFYKWQQQLEMGITKMPNEYYNGLNINYDFHSHPLTEGMCKNYEIMKETK